MNIRTGPSTANTILGQGQNGQVISVHCTQRDGSWWNITNVPTGVTGWVYWPDNVLIDFGVGNPPFC
ncbi:SH3 domain-containing protein [Streptomyces sp. M19]